MNCPICESKYVEELILYEPATYKHITKDLPLYISRCIDCEEEFANPTQTSLNARAMKHFEEEVNGSIDHYDKALGGLYDRGLYIKYELTGFLDYLRRNCYDGLYWEIKDSKLVEQYVKDCFGVEDE